jgi:hypothetical protein
MGANRHLAWQGIQAADIQLRKLRPVSFPAFLHSDNYGGMFKYT